ncbi:tetracycline efflux MFS transporter TetA(P) [Actinoplanes philippinensis]|uniref:MFS transporter, DHA3 family, tetracycline resistance protein n=1 Tax=Actinoplanes philippinensis TaxID=35752 RepID=A0A1I2AC93_9ACTN|nr:MFS transporter [Actinoplanes philippinensis]GIE74957.1 tetracycline efflux MFS transporter TetA(P) [Actinoplanes philippinensis]SFE41591.1 MFS transporter, DHA3 family, tetracycline resistance protein [Actinoplanes philippinensis]
MSQQRVYYLLTAVSGFLWTFAFTLLLVFHVQVAHLSPVQLVLVGTVMEITCFLGEVPTGVLADARSRTLSVQLGLILIGLSLLLQGGLPTFGWILAAQVVWGIGYTFTSGAIEAWIADEVGEERLTHVFLRGQRLELGAMVLGSAAAGAVGLLGLRLPMLLAGVGYLLLAVVLVALMREPRFRPAAADERLTFGLMRATFTAGVRQARQRPLVRSFLLVSLLVGLSGEAFDRLWTAHLLDVFALPPVLGVSSPAVWFAGLAIVGQLIGLGANYAVERAGLTESGHLPRLLTILVLVQVAGMIGFALAGALWAAVGALWARNAARALSGPLESAWLNRGIDSSTRATVLSVNSQFDAIGQVAGGPPLGALAGRTSIPVALLVSAGLLAPAAWIFARLGRRTAALARP